LKQLEAFAKAAYVPVGYLFLAQPPEDELPIPDLRTVGGRGIRRPSPNLLEVVYLCPLRQAWYQAYAKSIGEESRTFVGSAKTSYAPLRVAEAMRKRLGLTIAQRLQCRT